MDYEILSLRCMHGLAICGGTGVLERAVQGAREILAFLRKPLPPLPWLRSPCAVFTRSPLCSLRFFSSSNSFHVTSMLGLSSDEILCRRRFMCPPPVGLVGLNLQAAFAVLSSHSVIELSWPLPRALVRLSTSFYKLTTFSPPFFLSPTRFFYPHTVRKGCYASSSGPEPGHRRSRLRCCVQRISRVSKIAACIAPAVLLRRLCMMSITRIVHSTRMVHGLHTSTKTLFLPCFLFFISLVPTQFGCYIQHVIHFPGVRRAQVQRYFVQVCMARVHFLLAQNNPVSFYYSQNAKKKCLYYLYLYFC